MAELGETEPKDRDKGEAGQNSGPDGQHPGKGIDNLQKPQFTHSPSLPESVSFPFLDKIRKFPGLWVKEV